MASITTRCHRSKNITAVARNLKCASPCFSYEIKGRLVGRDVEIWPRRTTDGGEGSAMERKERKDLETLPRKTTETCKYNWCGVEINCARKMTKDHSLLPMLRDRYLWTLNSPPSLHQTCQNMSQIAAAETVNEVSTPIMWAAMRRGRKQIKGAC